MRPLVWDHNHSWDIAPSGSLETCHGMTGQPCAEKTLCPSDSPLRTNERLQACLVRLPTGRVGRHGALLDKTLFPPGMNLACRDSADVGGGAEGQGRMDGQRSSPPDGSPDQNRVAVSARS
ncbi:hypothetical protein SKAU_G00089310 [Synaphobranchus kaupii]|uniref:Uncharacterized protein n=1 Tax=Synaphobranchus kaupii TaxID=118154 RepID=A0A9Q1FW72_SYNKA|nr:hypothetical protein SKAU_G00089310 [Synaphobranchus kaupii]